MLKHLASATLLAAPAALASPAAAEVEITLTDLRTDAGDVYIALQTEGQFMQEAGIAGEIVANPQDSTVTITLPDIPDGRYSFTAYHDLDGNEQFSMGQMGPSDGWSMVGASELRAMPTFAAQSFVVEDGDASITEAMVYAGAGE